MVDSFPKEERSSSDAALRLSRWFLSVGLDDEARSLLKAADLPATNQSARAAADGTTLVADDLRRSLPAIRDSLEQLRDLARLLTEQPESVVYGPRPPAAKK